MDVTALLALVRRDVILAFRLGGGGALGVAFFLLVGMLTPIGLGGETDALPRIAGGVIWVAALLACLLSLDRLFQADWEDGGLDLLALAPLPLEAVAAAKALAHWLTTGLPLILAAPVLTITLDLPGAAFWPLMIALAAGTPGLSLIGAVGAALTVGVRRGGLLLSLLVLPLYLPTLILGARAVERAGVGLDPVAPLALLGAVTLVSAVVGPLAAAAALRVNLR
jgi:heme exporter protein B